MLDVFSTSDASRGARSRDSSDEQSRNIQDMISTLDMSRVERSRDVSDEQPWNILYMRSTLDVSRPDRSRDSSDEQPSNMQDMSVTLDVSRPDRSRDSRFEHLWNMQDMSVTLDVSRPDKSMVSSELQKKNMYSAVETAIWPSIFAEVIELLLSRQGASVCLSHSPSSPLSSPSSGAITRQPLASIIQRAVPLVVQPTIGSSDSPDCGAASPFSDTWPGFAEPLILDPP